MHRQGRWLIRIALLVLANSACTKVAPHAGVSTYYVSATAGSDDNSCDAARAEATPKKTILAGWLCAQAGDTVLLRGGSFDEQIIDNAGGTPVLPSGTETQPITIKAYPNETVWLRPTPADCYAPLSLSKDSGYVVFDGVNIDAKKCNEAIVVIWSGYGGGDPHHFTFLNAEWLGPEGTQYSHAFGVLLSSNTPSSKGGHVFRNLNIHGGGHIDSDHHFYVMVSNILVEHSDLWDFAGAGIQDYSGDGGVPNNNVYRYNRIHDARKGVGGCSVAGSNCTQDLPGRHQGVIIFTAERGTRVYGNTIWNIFSNGGGTYGIFVDYASNVAAWNNTISAVEGICAEFRGSGHRAANFACYGNHDDSILGDVVKTTNLEGVDPKWVNASAADFRLQEGSPAIDKATAVSGYTSDSAGTKIAQGPAPDIGAYEYTTGTPEPPTPTPTPPGGIVPPRVPTNVQVVARP